MEDIEYGIRLPEKRSEQIRQQAAYNLEVSILSGVAKHVGFPAAPELRAARPTEIDDDFRAMKVSPVLFCRTQQADFGVIDRNPAEPPAYSLRPSL